MVCHEYTAVQKRWQNLHVSPNSVDSRFNMDSELHACEAIHILCPHQKHIFSNGTTSASHPPRNQYYQTTATEIGRRRQLKSGTLTHAYDSTYRNPVLLRAYGRSVNYKLLRMGFIHGGSLHHDGIIPIGKFGERKAPNVSKAINAIQ